MKIRSKTFLIGLLKASFFIGLYLLIAFLLANNKIEAAPQCNCYLNSQCSGACPDLSAPSGLTWGSVSNPETQLQPTWGSVSGATYYNLSGSATVNNITNTYYLHTGLYPGKTYSYQVQACKSGCTLCIAGGSGCLVQGDYNGYCTINQTSCGPWSSSWSNTTAFYAPSGLSATPYSSSQCNLSWTDNSSAETNYLVERGSSSCSGFSQIASLSANTVSYSDSGLSEATTYCYRVRAYHSTAGTYSSYSGTATCTTPCAAVSGGPSSLSATAVSSSQINLSWTDGTSNETGFYIERCQGSGCSNFTQIASVGANTTSYSDTGLSEYTSYTYRVRAYRSCGTYSSYTNTASATTLCAAVSGGPSSLSATAVSSSQINLSWTDGTSNETGFYIERCQGSGCSNFTQIASVAANTISYSDTGLSQATTYCYRVRAYRYCGSYSSYTNTSCATTPSAYIDCGLRLYDGTAIVTIACEPLGTLTSPLRIAKNGNIYGIVLVPTTDANATKIRIQTSSGTKALRKY